MEKRDSRYTGQRILSIELPGRKNRERPQGRSMDAVKEDARDGVRWCQIIYTVVTPKRSGRKKCFASAVYKTIKHKDCCNQFYNLVLAL